MKITPLEIKQKTFEKGFRGYDKDEVHAFLNSLAQEWERINEEKKEIKRNLDSAQQDVKKLREVEASLYKTLKTAEDTGANMIDHANKTAELYLKEAQMKADAILNDAKKQAKTAVEEADEKVKMIISMMHDELKSLETEYRLAENHRDNLLMELRNISNDTLERVQKLSSKKGADTIKEVLKESRQAFSENPDIQFEIKNRADMPPISEKLKEEMENESISSKSKPGPEVKKEIEEGVAPDTHLSQPAEEEHAEESYEEPENIAPDTHLSQPEPEEMPEVKEEQPEPKEKMDEPEENQGTPAEKNNKADEEKSSGGTFFDQFN